MNRKSSLTALVFVIATWCCAVATVAAADAPVRTGKQVVDAACAMCHSTGAAGAPKIGDAKAWTPRISQGNDKLFEHVVKGFKAMPARGACTKCTDVEIKAAIDYFVTKAQE